MKITNRVLYIAWAALYILCAVLSAIAAPAGGWLIPELLCSLLFFVPPAVLLYRAVRDSSRFVLRLIRNISIAALVLTTVIICLTFASVGAGGGADVGMALQILLILVSVPMMCSPIWGLSLFFWACLLMVCIKYRKIAAPVPAKKQPVPQRKTKKKKKR